MKKIDLYIKLWMGQFVLLNVERIMVKNNEQNNRLCKKIYRLGRFSSSGIFFVYDISMLQVKMDYRRHEKMSLAKPTAT